MSLADLITTRALERDPEKAEANFVRASAWCATGI